jgi:hypothetical protein
MEAAMLNNDQTLLERKDMVMRSMEAVPTQIYWGLAMGSVILSALLYGMGKRNPALFVGQWPPTFLALALLYKLLRPSREQGSTTLRDAMGEQSSAAR